MNREPSPSPRLIDQAVGQCNDLEVSLTGSTPLAPQRLRPFSLRGDGG
jgi:hypothetical protein